MAADTTTAPEAEVEAVQQAGAAGFSLTHGRPIFTWRDLGTPLLVLVIAAALYLYVSAQDLDTIEANSLSASTLAAATLEHIQVSLTIAFLVVAIAVPLGILVTRKRTRRLGPFVVAIANVGQAAPSLGLLALVGIFTFGFWAVVWILTAYAALSVLRNTIVGLQGVDPGVLDAARGMGLSPTAILFRVELPLAVPIIGAGVRTALVLAVGTVPLGQALGAGGLGSLLFGAIKTNRTVVIFTVAIMIALLALLMDWAAGIAQRAGTPRGIR